jgi:hypothetical protein
MIRSLCLTYCIPIFRSLGIFLLLKLALTRSSDTKTIDFLTCEVKTDGNVPGAASGEVVVAAGRNASGNDDVKLRQLWNYIYSVFPPVYDTHRSIWSSMYDELISYHPYITIFNWTDACSAREKVTTGVYLLTVQSMLMFLMAVFIDLEVNY